MKISWIKDAHPRPSYMYGQNAQAILPRVNCTCAFRQERGRCIMQAQRQTSLTNLCVGWTNSSPVAPPCAWRTMHLCAYVCARMRACMHGTSVCVCVCVGVCVCVRLSEWLYRPPPAAAQAVAVARDRWTVTYRSGCADKRDDLDRALRTCEAQVIVLTCLALEP